MLTLAKLSEEYPDRLTIKSNLLRARTNFFASAWFPPTPDDLAALLEDASRRLVRSEDELADLLLEVLATVQGDLPAHAELLWDRLPGHVLPKESELKEAWLPKREAALSAYLANQLLVRLDRRGLAVNREVLVKPTNAYGSGDRTDILVEAMMRDDPLHGPVPARLAVVVEVKGSWNEKLMKEQREQLAQRYLPEAHTETGIYLVGWYPLELWTDEKDYRRGRVKNIERARLVADLEAQAEDIRADLATRTRPFVLDIPRPSSTDQAVAET